MSKNLKLKDGGNMIDADKTKQKYGYEVSSLAPTSTVPVCWKCDECGAEEEYSYAYCLRKQEAAKSRGTKELCQKCSHAHRKGQVTKKKVEGQSYVNLPPEVDVKATMDRFGYDPQTLSPWSRKRIVVVCKESGKVCTPRRCGLNRYKSILETGHFISTGAWTAKRRKGVKASEETKKSMSQSQKNRRAKEKMPKPAVAATQKPVTPSPTTPFSQNPFIRK